MSFVLAGPDAPSVYLRYAPHNPVPDLGNALAMLIGPPHVTSISFRGETDGNGGWAAPHGAEFIISETCEGTLDDALQATISLLGEPNERNRGTNREMHNMMYPERST